MVHVASPARPVRLALLTLLALMVCFIAVPGARAASGPGYDLTGAWTNEGDNPGQTYDITMDSDGSFSGSNADGDDVSGQETGCQGEITETFSDSDDGTLTADVTFGMQPDGEIAGYGEWENDELQSDGDVDIVLTSPADADQPVVGGCESLDGGTAPSTTSVTCVKTGAGTPGAADTCTATVTGSGGTPTGTVLWRDDTGGTSGLSASSCTLNGTSCSVTYSPPAAGDAPPITAGYIGDESFQTSTGAPVSDLPTIALTLTPSTVNVCEDTCTSANSSQAVVTVTGPDGKGVDGQNVTLSADDPAVTFSSVSGQGGGTYGATVYPSSSLEAVTVTATDTSVTPAITATATLDQQCDSGTGSNLRWGERIAMDSAHPICTETLVDCNDNDGVATCQAIVRPTNPADTSPLDAPMQSNVILSYNLVFLGPKNKVLGSSSNAGIDCPLTLLPPGRGAMCSVDLPWPASVMAKVHQGTLQTGTFYFTGIQAVFGAGTRVVCPSSTSSCFKPSSGGPAHAIINSTEISGLLGSNAAAGSNGTSGSVAGVAAGTAAGGSGTASSIRFGLAVTGKATAGRAIGRSGRRAVVSSATPLGGATLVTAAETELWQALTRAGAHPRPQIAGDSRVLKAVVPHVSASLFPDSTVGREERSLVMGLMSARGDAVALTGTEDRLIGAESAHQRAATGVQRTAMNRDIAALTALLRRLPAGLSALASGLSADGLSTVTLSSAEIAAWRGTPAALRSALSAIGAARFSGRLDAAVAALEPGTYPLAAEIDSPSLISALDATVAGLVRESHAPFRPGDRL